MRPRALCVANARGVPGTASALVRDARGALGLLSNHHVLFGRGARAGDPVWAIPADDDPASGLHPARLGPARPGLIGRLTVDGEPCFVDCALVELDDSGRFPPWLREALAGAWPSALAAAEPGMPVLKDGAATGLTEGVVADVAYPDAPFIDGRTWAADGQILVDSRDPEWNFSAPGDSGAAVVDEAGRVVGLLWGSNANGQGIACPIGPVLDRLGVTLVEAPRPIWRST